MSAKRLGLLAIAAGLIASGWFLSPKQKQEWRRAPDNVARFPARLPHRYFVSDKDERTNVLYYQDNVTPRQALTDAPDGLLYETQFKPGGLRSSWKIFYPNPDGGRGQLRQESTFTADGSSFVHDTVYFRSGKVFQVGLLQAPDKFSKTYYFEDGRIRRNEVHIKRDSKWSLEWAEEFDASTIYPVPKLVESVRRLDDGTMQLKRFKPNGKLLVMVGNTPGNATKIETWYYEDGKTPHFEVFRSDYNLTVTTFSPNRRKLEERVFYKPFGESEMEVTFFDHRKRKTHTQLWSMDGGKYVLGALQTYFTNGQEKRLIVWGKSEEGKIFIEMEQIYLSSRADKRPYKQYTFDSSGRVVKYERSWGDFFSDYSQDYKPGNGPLHSIDLEFRLTSPGPYKLPPPEVQEQTIALPPSG